MASPGHFAPISPVGPTSILQPMVFLLSIAPNAGQDKAGQSHLPHFAVRAARGETQKMRTKTRKNRKMRTAKTRKMPKMRMIGTMTGFRCGPYFGLCQAIRIAILESHDFFGGGGGTFLVEIAQGMYKTYGIAGRENWRKEKESENRPPPPQQKQKSQSKHYDRHRVNGVGRAKQFLTRF